MVSISRITLLHLANFLDNVHYFYGIILMQTMKKINWNRTKINSVEIFFLKYLCQETGQYGSFVLSIRSYLTRSWTERQAMHGSVCVIASTVTLQQALMPVILEVVEQFCTRNTRPLPYIFGYGNLFHGTSYPGFPLRSITSGCAHPLFCQSFQKNT